MPQRPVDRNQLIGQKFGRWTVIEFVDVTKHRMIRWRCQCECGTQAIVLAMNLRNGNSLSCGCLKVERSTTHGHTSRIKYGHASETYQSWQCMLARCSRVTDKEYANYGARGITVCPEWMDFERFLLDMGIRPPGTSLDRRENSGNYNRDNCRWATPIEQGGNRRTNRNINIAGVTKCLSAWAREWGIEDSVINNRLNRGWPVDKLHLPPKRMRLQDRLKGAL